MEFHSIRLSVGAYRSTFASLNLLFQHSITMVIMCKQSPGTNSSVPHSNSIHNTLIKCDCLCGLLTPIAKIPNSNGFDSDLLLSNIFTRNYGFCLAFFRKFFGIIVRNFLGYRILFDEEAPLDTVDNETFNGDKYTKINFDI